MLASQGHTKCLCSEVQGKKLGVDSDAVEVSRHVKVPTVDRLEHNQGIDIVIDLQASTRNNEGNQYKKLLAPHMTRPDPKQPSTPTMCADIRKEKH